MNTPFESRLPTAEERAKRLFEGRADIARVCSGLVDDTVYEIRRAEIAALRTGVMVVESITASFQRKRINDQGQLAYEIVQDLKTRLEALQREAASE
jgi:hypothetical protein